MRNILSILILSLSLFATPKTAIAQNKKEVTEWPFPMLNYYERKARLDFFLNIKLLVTSEKHSTRNTQSCNSLLENLKEKKYQILEPKHIFKTKNTREAELFPQCSDQIDTFYVNGSAEGDAFQKTTPHFNREYYDFSSILGKNIWGFFAEGGHLECGQKAQHICDRFADRKYGGYTAGTIFNNDDCSVMVGPYLPLSRLTMRDSSMAQVENASFYAFLKIGRNINIYRLAFNYPVNSGFHGLLSTGGATMMLTDSNGDTCVFLPPGAIQ